MPTPAEIDEQLALEQEAISFGIDKLHKDTRKAEEKEYASSSYYGRASISASQDLIVAQILDTFKNIKARKNGRYHADIVRHLHVLNNVEGAHILAMIALKKVFDLVFSQRATIKVEDWKKPVNTPQNVCHAVGKAIEQECQLRWYKEQDPNLFKHIKEEYWKSVTGTQQKATVTKLMMNRREHRWERWPDNGVKCIGAWLVDTISETTGWFHRVCVTPPGRADKKYDLIEPTAAFLALQEELQMQAEMFAPIAWPMLIEPNDWTNEKPGGYLMNEVMRGHTLVRKGKPSIIQPEKPLAFLNKLQKVGYRLNEFTYGVAKELDRRGMKLGKFKPLSYAANMSEPVKPPEMEGELFDEWKRQRRDYETAKKKYLRSDHVRTSMTMEVAKRFEGKTFYLPWSFDYRGRVYPIPPFLSIQDTDFGKSLVRFAEEAFMTPEAEEWLAFQVATTYGLDKKPISERIEWAKENHELITQVAKDPIGCLPLWESADEPWQFLSACEEYYACIISCDRQFTGLMIATDATCSGMQILAGLAKDAKTAELVNVTPGLKPADAYTAVLNQMLSDVPPHLRQYCDRSVAKRSVMTIPYNATAESSKKYVYEALVDNIKAKHNYKDEDKLPRELDPSMKDCYKIATAIREAMDVIAPGPLRVMDWLGKSFLETSRDGREWVQWSAPSGFIVTQVKNEPKTKRLETQLMGRCQMRVDSGEYTIRPQKHKASGAPNLIHSIDGSLLCLTFIQFEGPFSVIHDSILCRATDMGSLSRLIRESYYEVFSGESFLLDFKRQIGASTDPPIIGDLNVEEVLNSTYFFS